MNDLPEEVQELVLKFTAKSVTRMFSYSNEQAEAYQQGIKDVMEFMNELAETHTNDNKIDIGSMDMDEFNQFMKEQLENKDSK